MRKQEGIYEGAHALSILVASASRNCRWVVAVDAEAAQKAAEEKFPGKVLKLSQASSFPVIQMQRLGASQICKLIRQLGIGR